MANPVVSTTEVTDSRVSTTEVGQSNTKSGINKDKIIDTSMFIGSLGLTAIAAYLHYNPTTNHSHVNLTGSEILKVPYQANSLLKFWPPSSINSKGHKRTINQIRLESVNFSTVMSCIAKHIGTKGYTVKTYGQITVVDIPNGVDYEVVSKIRHCVQQLTSTKYANTTVVSTPRHLLLVIAGIMLCVIAVTGLLVVLYLLYIRYNLYSTYPYLMEFGDQSLRLGMKCVYRHE